MVLVCVTLFDRVLDDRGSATYSHEMTHLLDRTVLFNNHGRRDGTGAEFYARGIFENSYTPETDTYFNLNLSLMKVRRWFLQ